MPRFAANISWLFTELPFVERFHAAKAAGFEAVEAAFPYPHPPEELREQLLLYGLELVLLNAPAGNWGLGDRGIACLPDREQEFQRSVETALSYAKSLELKRLHVMAGKLAHLDRSVARAMSW